MGHLLFLSHAGIDSDAAVNLAERIEDSVDAQRSGLQVFIDKPDMRAGGDWKAQLQRELRDSTAFAVYVGSKGVANWVWNEVSVALDRANSDPDYPLIPILSAAADLKELPSFLSQYQAVSDVEKQPEQFEKLLRGILRLAPRAPVAAEREPFVGLDAFDSRKSHLFFGRENEVEELVDLLRHEPLIMVVGDSGSGKSSLVKAGLVPAFRGGRLGRRRDDGPDETLWYVVETRPGTDPFARLADDLRKAAEAAGKGPKAANEIAELVREKKPSKVRDALLSVAPSDPGLKTQVLLVVDQFEELRASPDAFAYADTLTSLAPEGDDTIRIVLTMRRDYYYLCSSFPALYERLERNNRRARYHLNRISKERLPKSVTEPLRLAGIASHIRTMLADAVTKDAGDEPGELALLQMALWRTWARRNEYQGDLLRSYQAIGRVEGAIAQHAEEVFESLTDQEKQAAEGLFLRLVRPGESGGVTRRTAKIDEFDPNTQSLAKKLGGERFRLLNLGESTVEITHEALATQWSRYQRWISNAPNDARGDDLRTLQSLIADAEGWAQADDKQKHEHFARGYHLSLQHSLAVRRPSWVANREQNYVDASRRSASAATRTKQAAVAALVALACTSAGFGYYAWHQRNAIQDSFDQTKKLLQDVSKAQLETSTALYRADRALNNAQIAQSLFLADQARQNVDEGDSGKAILLALEALPDASIGKVRPVVPEAEAALFKAHQVLRERIVLSEHGDSVRVANFAPNGRRLITASDDHTARLWDAETGGQTAVLRGHTATVRFAAFNPDGQKVITTSEDHTARLWSVHTNEPPIVLRGHDGPVTSAAFSADNGRVITASADGTARIWDVSTGTQLVSLHQHANVVHVVAFSSDGKFVVTASDSARLWNARSGELIHEFDQHNDAVLSVAFDSKAKHLVTGSKDKTARVWSIETRRQIDVEEHSSPVASVVFSPDGQTVASASDDGMVRLWNPHDHKRLPPFRGHTERVNSAVFSLDGRMLLTASDDRTARIWNIGTGMIEAVLKGHVEPVRSAVFSPDSAQILTGSRDGTARLWSLEPHKGKRNIILRGHVGPVKNASFSPNRQLVATASDDHTAIIWDALTGKQRTVLQGHLGPVKAAVFSPDSRRLVTASSDQSIQIWDVQTGKGLSALKGNVGDVLNAVFSPDGLRVAATSENGATIIFNAETGRLIASFKNHDGPVYGVSFVSNGNQILTTGADRTIQLWDIETGRQVARSVQLGDHHYSRIHNAAISPDGTQVVTVGDDNIPRLWNARTGSLKAALRGHRGSGIGAAFSSDGKRIATAADDGTVRIWDAEAGKTIAVLENVGSVWSVAFNSDGEWIVTTSDDQIAQIWPIFSTLQRLIDKSKSITPRCLNQEQRESAHLDTTSPQWCFDQKKWPIGSISK